MSLRKEKEKKHFITRFEEVEYLYVAAESREVLNSIPA